MHINTLLAKETEEST